MLITSKQSIIISYGDTFCVTFHVDGFLIQPEDKVVFTIKQDLSRPTTLITREFSNIQGNEFTVEISETDMKRLTAGSYYYDIVCVSKDKQTTLMFPARLTVRQVVHNE